ncbi:hypothetical protein N9C56_01035 [Paracoccaceae bacterium]|nr:hypothetical protein [Paracoccaceae bacterium]
MLQIDVSADNLPGGKPQLFQTLVSVGKKLRFGFYNIPEPSKGFVAARIILANAVGNTVNFICNKRWAARCAIDRLQCGSDTRIQQQS